MRWDYVKPDPKSFVLADEKVRLYDPQALTLMVSPVSTDKLSASVTFLWGKGRLLNEFSISEKACAKCTGTLLEMTPLHPDPRFRQVLLEVDPKTAIVLASTVIDPDGSTNLIRFINLDTATPIKTEQFVLNLAKGTQIIDLGAASSSRDAGASVH
jgi:outer membrane lipoprotein carrier protein